MPILRSPPSRRKNPKRRPITQQESRVSDASDWFDTGVNDLRDTILFTLFASLNRQLLAVAEGSGFEESWHRSRHFGDQFRWDAKVSVGRWGGGQPKTRPPAWRSESCRPACNRHQVVLGRLDTVTNGCFQVSEFNDSFTAINLIWADGLQATQTCRWAL